MCDRNKLRGSRLIRRVRVGALLLGLLSAAGQATAAGSTPSLREHLYDVSMVTPSDGWAAGAFGTIARTTDGGATWRRQASGSGEQLFGIDFGSPTVGWAVGRAGTIVHTADGTSWATQQSGTDKHLFKVRARGPGEAWAVGDWGAVVHTTDGGRTWHDRSLPEDVILNDITFADARTGWIVGEVGSVFITGDDGATWVRQETGTDKSLFGAYFADAQRGWVVGLDGLLLRTTDGGSSWDVLHGRSEIGSLDQMGFLEALKNPSLYTVQVRGAFGLAVGDMGTILVSRDGGATWAPEDVPEELRPRWLRGVDLASQGNGLLVGANGLAIPLVDGRLRYPKDE